MPGESTLLPTLQTARLVLRPSAASDLADYHALLVDPAGGRLVPRPPESMRDTEQRLALTVARQEAGDLMNWAIAESAEGSMLGHVCLVRIDRAHQRSEVGYRLRSDHWGKGYMTEALTHVAAYAFETLGFHRLEGHTSPVNRRSIGVLERCGFRFEGILRENFLMDGEFHDSAIYGRLAGEPLGP
jgi:RimJ/RimL family protein N-acetyltransferase